MHSLNCLCLSEENNSTPCYQHVSHLTDASTQKHLLFEPQLFNSQNQRALRQNMWCMRREINSTQNEINVKTRSVNEKQHLLPIGHECE